MNKDKSITYRQTDILSYDDQWLYQSLDKIILNVLNRKEHISPIEIECPLGHIIQTHGPSEIQSRCVLVRKISTKN